MPVVVDVIQKEGFWPPCSRVAVQACGRVFFRLTTKTLCT